MTNEDAASLLRTADLRATSGRLELLKILSKESKPASVEKLHSLLQGAMNQVTLYRALETLEKTGIVARINLEHDHAHFELISGRPHHHHAVCRECGLIEDIEVPHSEAPEKDATKRTKEFARIERYSLEFFGLCRACV